MQIYNSQTQKKEEFKSIEKNKIKMYVCGPTLYGDIHIGNARPIIFFDVVYRSFKLLGYDVNYVSNITDVDDKIINKALENGILEKELVEENFKEFKKILNKLNLLEVEKRPTVTNYIQEIIKFIDELIEKKFAYIGENGDVYFRTNKIENYGQISGRNIEELKSGTRIDTAVDKEFDKDFVLWKKTKVGIVWDAPFGSGRPGWHSECVVMIRELLGESIDIHGGGVDLKFPHHENENAQNKAMCSKELANFWMHNGFVNIDSQKMSKSLNNFITVKDLLEKYSGNIIRLILLQTNYQKPINLSENFIYQTVKLNQKIQRQIQKISNFNQKIEELNSLSSEKSHEKLLEVDKEIAININDDFNTPNLISIVIKIIKEYQSTNKFNIERQKDFLILMYVLGINSEANIVEETPEEINELILKRQQAKKEKNFELADAIKKQINDLGYEVKDTRNGTEVKKLD